MKNEILPCPFCGTIPEILTEANFEGRSANAPIPGPSWTQIRCVNSECLPAVYIHRQFSKEEVIKLWNTRNG
jgi:hypothetical protein